MPIQIFRLPGIYGPGRSTFEAIRNNKIKVIFKENQVFSRIHVEDIANAIVYLLENKNSLDFHRIINIADDEPCSQIEVIQYCYKLLGLKMPPPALFEKVKNELSPIAQSFWIENRRVSNDLLCKKLGYKLTYRNYKEGLENCFFRIFLNKVALRLFFTSVLCILKHSIVFKNHIMVFGENTMKNKIQIVISVGDDLGIGPEITLKALFSKHIQKNIDFLIVGSRTNLQKNYLHLKSIGVKDIVDPNDYQIHDINVPNVSKNPKSNYGNASFHYLK